MACLLSVLVACGGAGCPRALSRYTPAGPRILPATATLDDVTRAVNDNSARIQSISCSDATISTPGIPTLKANIALERPRRLRVRAETTLTGTEADIGSNDELFWFWMKRMPEPAVYYCRHDQFATSPMKQLIPIEPEWIIDAVGLASFEPGGKHSGPYPVRGGKLEIRTERETPNGLQTKITVVDEQRALVLEQHLYDARGTRIATAITTQHYRDPVSGAFVPREIELQVPATQFSITMRLKTVQVNQLGQGPSPTFALPNYPGASPVDLANPHRGLAPADAPTVSAPPPRTTYPATRY
jgi:hypothetical protein